MNLLSCPDSVPNLWGLFDTSIAPKLLYYSYIPIVLLVLFIGFLVFFKDKRSLQSKLFLGIALSFSFWIALVLMQWIGVHVQAVHFSWQLLALFEVLIFLFSFYFAYVFINNHDVSSRVKKTISLLLMGLIVLIPSKFNISLFEFENCEGVIGQLWYGIYAIEVLTVGGVLWLGVRGFRSKIQNRSKREILLLTIGISLFLALFSASNILGEITQRYEINLFGSIGMAVFIAILGYMVVRYSSFSIRVIGAQVLVFALSFLVFALLFIRNIESVQLVAFFTLILVILIGRTLIKGVRREVAQRKHLEQLTQELGQANDKLKELDKLKTEFISLVSHQIRTPLTAIRGYASLLTEDSYGKLTEPQENAVKRIYTSAQELANMVEDFLNVSKIEQGGFKYEFMQVGLGAIVADLASEMKIPAESKGLELRVEIPDNDAFTVNADPTKIKQVFLNLVDNSIKYTKAGFVEIGIKREGANVVFYVKDSGIGMTEETKGKLFQKFSRGTEGGKVNTGGSGLGLYLAKEIVLAHKGDIVIDSEGAGKGTTFTVTIPAI